MLRSNAHTSLLGLKKEEFVVRAMYRHMTPRLPTGLPRIVGVVFIGVARVTQASREGIQHFGVVRAVWTVALHTPVVGQIRYGVVFVHKGPRHFPMTRNTVLLARHQAFMVIAVWMDVVTVATHHTPLW